jgi:hypothetical protein
MYKKIKVLSYLYNLYHSLSQHIVGKIVAHFVSTARLKMLWGKVLECLDWVVLDIVHVGFLQVGPKNLFTIEFEMPRTFPIGCTF